MKYLLHPAAAAEHRRQVAYYEQQQPGLGKRYHADFLTAVAQAYEAPQRHRVIRTPGIRRVGFEIFSFELIYREVAGVVQILAIPHHRRRPGYWLSRL